MTLLLPALAVAADAVVGRWRLAAPVVGLLLLIGVPANIRALAEKDTHGPATGTRDLVLAAAYSPLLDELPDDVYPNPSQLGAADVTTGFLKRAKEAGDLPDEPKLTDRQKARIWTRLSLGQRPNDEPPDSSLTCEVHTTPITVNAVLGDQFSFLGQIEVEPLDPPPGLPETPARYDERWNGRGLRVEVPTFDFEVRPATGQDRFSFCQ
ncbi:MAG: hypothetical protein GY798_08715 [Hyphomicrobiales bacterium]|nr:hypothetical protein [Hyphomicrobiales bacterium]